MWAVTLLAGVNDTEEDAHALLRHARQFYDQTRLRPQIRLIPFNSIDAPGPPSYQRTDETREKVFCGILRGGGFPMHKRYSGGADVHAACGQLSGLLRQ
jgi:adenine C2-methylase RlmN of 23S rRNA A2503 and tRNA A37